MTEEIMEKLPEVAVEMIKELRADAKHSPVYRDHYICRGLGYIEALKDVGKITECERYLLARYILTA